MIRGCHVPHDHVVVIDLDGGVPLVWMPSHDDPLDHVVAYKIWWLLQKFELRSLLD